MTAIEELAVRAVRLATDNAAAGQLPFGAVVVRDGKVLATGVNTALHDWDPSAHAEVIAVRAACAAVGEVHVTGAIVVSSCEPCAICHAVAATAGVERIYYAAPKEWVPDLGYPAPPVHGELLAGMQRLFREAAPEQIVYLPTEGADEPFRRYLAGIARNNHADADTGAGASDTIAGDIYAGGGAGASDATGGDIRAGGGAGASDATGGGRAGGGDTNGGGRATSDGAGGR